MQHDALLPRPADGMAPGAVLALLVHGGLLAALTLGVSWRMKAPEIVSAELWAAVPQIAAPKLEAPPPPPAPAPAPAPDRTPIPRPAPAPPPVQAAPNEAQIAIERAERRRVEREKQALEAKAKADAEKAAKAAELAAAADKKKKLEDAEKKRDAAEAKVEQDKLEKARAEQIKRMLSGLPDARTDGTAAPGSRGIASRDAAPSASYAGKLIASIRRQIIYTADAGSNPAAEVSLRATPTGTIISRRVTKSSGLKAWDDAVLRALDRIDTLPADTDGRVPSEIVITFRPND